MTEQLKKIVAAMKHVKPEQINLLDLQVIKINEQFNAYDDKIKELTEKSSNY